MHVECVCVCVCVPAQYAERLSLCDGFEAGRLWMLQWEGRGEGPAQLHSGAGGGGEVGCLTGQEASEL